MANDSGHGGKRPGAGRPKGARGRRSQALADRLIAAGQCPVDALVRLAEEAEVQGDLSQAIGAWKSVLPYVYPKPKPVESDPEGVIALAQGLAEVRRQLIDEGEEEPFFAALARELERAEMNRCPNCAGTLESH